jgi:hypothetical protein
LRKNQGHGCNVVTRNRIVGSATDVVLNTMTENNKIDDKIWIGDSGAFCHYCNSKEDLYNCKVISEETTVGKSNKMIVKKARI